MDFLTQLFALAPVLLADIAILLPSRVNYFDAEIWANSERIGTYSLREKKGSIIVEANGLSYDDLDKSISKQAGEGLETQLLEMPWLLGARLEDFIYVLQKNPDEFDLYAEALRKFIGTRTRNPETLARWIKDVSLATKELDIIFKNKRRELVGKGLDVTVGTICTVGTLLLPDTMAPIKAALTTLFSTKTMYEAVRWIHEYRQAKDLLGDKKDWLLWRIKR